jgi:hypothetical protein
MNNTNKNMRLICKKTPLQAKTTNNPNKIMNILIRMMNISNNDNDR